MDVELARTFLAIIECGTFVGAAKRLHLTQTTVSARVRSLEGQLGRRLFVRNKAGASLTSAGRQFHRYAPAIIQMWERARSQVAVPEGHRALLSIGAELSLWNPLLLNWLVWMRREEPSIAIQTKLEVPEALNQQLANGVLDIALTYRPMHREGVVFQRLFEEKLVMVTTDPGGRPLTGPTYVYVDWGPEFAAHHSANFPELTNPGVSVGLGPLGLGVILKTGGSGYFRISTVRPYLTSQQLYLVPDAPDYLYPAYAAYVKTIEDDLLQTALRGLNEVASSDLP